MTSTKNNALADLEKRLSQTENELVIGKLLGSIFYRDDNHQWQYDNQHLYDNPVFLEHYFWIMFHYPGNVFWADHYQDGKWVKLIVQLTDEELIERQRLLTEALEATQRNFGRNTTRWFIALVMALKLTKEEVLARQDLVMGLLSIHDSKPINEGLKLLKTIVDTDIFNHDDFLAHSGVLLTHETKSVVMATLTVFNKLAKNKAKLSADSTLTDRLCNEIVQAFISSDETIQTKVAKFILAYMDKTTIEASLDSDILMYYPTLFSSVKNLLSPILDVDSIAHIDSNDIEDSDTEDSDDRQTIHLKPNALNNKLHIQMPSHIDEQIFFITQAFENNNFYDFDIYCAVVPAFVTNIIAASSNTTVDISSHYDFDYQTFSLTLEKLSPALQNAMRAIQAFNSVTGVIEFLMAMHFINVIGLLLKVASKQSIPIKLQKLYDNITMATVDERGRLDNTYIYNLCTITTPNQDSPSHRPFAQLIENFQLVNPVLTIFNELLIHSKQLTIKRIQTLEDAALESQTAIMPATLLSTPTHAPCYVALDVFCQRLSVYLDQNKNGNDSCNGNKSLSKINVIDFQVAMTRLSWNYDGRDFTDRSTTNATLAQLIDRLKDQAKPYLSEPYAGMVLYLLNDADYDLTYIFTSIDTYLDTPVSSLQTFDLDNEPSAILQMGLSVVYRKAQALRDNSDLKAFIDRYQLPHGYLYQALDWRAIKHTKSYEKNNSHIGFKEDIQIVTHSYCELSINSYPAGFVPRERIDKRRDKMIYLDWLWQPHKCKDVSEWYMEGYFEVDKYKSSTYYKIRDQELVKLVMLSPFEPSIALTEIARHSCQGFTTTGEQNRIRYIIGVLLEIWDKNFDDGGYLYVVATLLAEKHNGQLVCELWIKAVSENNMDNVRFGRTLGRLLQGEFAPLKRFTDLVISQLIGISTGHNQALISVITHTIINMNDEPIKGVKKLLELYLELLTVTDTNLPSVVTTKLDTWMSTKSLKSVITKLNKLL